ncbi:SIR2 family protein [Janibacter sp. G368]|uniref:SIR2 family protein n=1 Tax=Janibacter sp. G368 TaxID=3420441 RepID=UPI003D08D501
MTTNDPQRSVAFYKGKTNTVDTESSETIATVRRDIADALNSKNLAFLLGSGCSSFQQDGRELGIPTMGPMAKKFMNATTGKHRITATDRQRLKSSLGLNLDDKDYGNNLERLLEVLFAQEIALRASTRPAMQKVHAVVQRVIRSVTAYVRSACTDGEFSRGDETVLRTYMQFYRRLAQRDRALPRPWVFTTNYDLFNETAMDRLGIPYINGFLGSIERRFNPSVFRYALSEQLDISNRKWSSVDSLMYFAKLHGSVSWESRGDGLFPVVETAPSLISSEQLLIYPSPAKQNASFAAPYSDLFREFQTRVVRDQSVLVTVGYSFGDEHVNNIIFQALTIPTFRLVAFVDPFANETVTKLRELDDPRIWIVGTEDKQATWKAHYFSTLVEDILATGGSDNAEEAINSVLTNLLGRGHKTPDSGARR